MSFILIKNLGTRVILGTPFITSLYPFRVTLTDIISKILGKEIRFKFTYPVEEKSIKFLQDSIIKPTFINLLQAKQKHYNFLVKEVKSLRIKDELNQSPIKERIQKLKEKLEKEVCASIPNTFWNRKKHIVNLHYIKDFNEKDIPTKSRSIHMNEELESVCKKEINDLLEKKLIRKSKSLWSCKGIHSSSLSEVLLD